VNGTNLTHIQIIVIGVAILFGLPICVGLAIGYFFGFGFGIASGGLVLLLIAYLASRWMKKVSKQDKED